MRYVYCCYIIEMMIFVQATEDGTEPEKVSCSANTKVLLNRLNLKRLVTNWWLVSGFMQEKKTYSYELVNETKPIWVSKLIFMSCFILCICFFM